MRIDLNLEAQVRPESGRTTSQSAVESPVESPLEGPVSAGEDQAQLSGVHVQVQALAAQVSQLPEIRQEKVSALRQMVLGSSYQLSSKQVAEAVLAHMLAKPAA